MIFYFTGTGNSLFAADILAELTGDKCVDMADSLKKGALNFKIEKNEKIGFVFPVYYGGLPTVVDEFIGEFILKAEETPYVYAVATCGGSGGGCLKILSEKLMKKGIVLSFAKALVMPDNYVILYNPMDKEKAEKLLEKNRRELTVLSGEIMREERVSANSGAAANLTSALMQAAYPMFRKTAKFYADGNCVACEKCLEICPVNAIRMEGGKPKWIKKDCAHCTACINRCPKGAIQYGKGTVKRNRYVNPILK